MSLAARQSYRTIMPDEPCLFIDGNGRLMQGKVVSDFTESDGIRRVKIKYRENNVAAKVWECAPTIDRVTFDLVPMNDPV